MIPVRRSTRFSPFRLATGQEYLSPEDLTEEGWGLLSCGKVRKSDRPGAAAREAAREKARKNESVVSPARGR